MWKEQKFDCSSFALVLRDQKFGCYFGKERYDIGKKKNGEVIEKSAVLIESIILINYILI